MPIVQLKDGTELEFDDNYTDQQIADGVDHYVSTQGIQQQQQEPRQEGFQEANRRRIGQFAMGIPQGLGNLAVGATQAITDLVNPSGDSQFSQNLAKEVGKLKQKQSQLSTSERAGIFTGEVAPLLPVGAGMGLITGSAVGGAASSALSPQEKSGLENRLIETGKGAAISAGTAGTLKVLAQTGQGIGNLITSGGKELIQKAVGINAKSRETLKAFQDAGISPRLADITDSKPTKAFQNLLEVFPGSASTIQNATQNQTDDITSQLARLTKSEGGTIQQAGKKIQEGAKDFKGFVEKRINKLYDDLDQFLPKESNQIPTNNLKALIQNSQIQDVAVVGAGDTARVINRYQQIIDEGGNISYPRLKTFRSTIGKKLESPSLMGDERGALKKIYGALSEDMKQAIIQNGGEKGLQAFNKANSAFARSQEFLEKSINPLIDAKTPEAVYSMALSGSKQGGSNIKAIMTTLKSEQQDFLRGTIVKRMGLQNAGLQDSTGEVFSPNKFLTEWNKLSPEAKTNLFTENQISSVNNLNKAISGIKETSKIAQKSNNLPYLNWLGLGSAVLASPLSAAQAGGAVVGAKISAEMMTNPKFINWLARAPKISEKGIPNHLRELSIIASQNPQIREDVLGYLDSITSNANSEASK